MEKEKKPGFRKMEAAGVFGRLYPGENKVHRYRMYQACKYRAMLAVIVIGAVSAVCVHLSSRMQYRLEEGTHLRRNEWGEGNYKITLLAKTKELEEELEFEVEERKLTEEEFTKLKGELKDRLPEMILGSNTDLLSVRTKLNLLTKMQGFPFSITWQSSNYQRVRADGSVNTEELPREGEPVVLTAQISYREKKWEETIPVQIMPPVISPKEEYGIFIRSLLEDSNERYANEPELVLPQSIGDIPVVWEEKREDNSFWMLFLGIVGAFLVSLGMDRDLQKKDEKRREELIGDYSEFVSKLQLYMGAGLTAGNAFLKIGADYQKEKERFNKKRFVYEEVLISGYQLLNGKAEDRVYREWGDRCDEMHYRKLGFLLSVHLKQGNEKILTLLSEETEEALEERRKWARKQGEEAGVKMLLPMTVMLLVVMFLILFPAFAGFGA